MQFRAAADAFRCADALHGSRFGAKKSLVCDFVTSVQKPRPVVGRSVVISNAFDPSMPAVMAARGDHSFLPQLEFDFKAACGQCV